MAKATIAGLASAKGIPPAFLARITIEDERGVAYVYKDLDGTQVRSHVRHKLESSQPSTWAKDGEKIVPFGSQLVAHYRKNGVTALTIAEGDIDAVTAWLHRIPALGLPGASMYGLLTLAHVESFLEILIALDSDEPGEAAVLAVARHLRSIGYQGRIRRVSPAPHKDLNEMHLALNGRFDDEWARRVADAPDVEVCVEHTASSAPSGFMLAYDFAAQVENESTYLVDKLLAIGGTFAVIAKPKVGKSTLALSLALAVSRGDDFLGRATLQGPVLYVALEGSAGEWKRVLRALGVQAEDSFHFFHGKRPENVGPWLREAIEAFRPVLIIFDTLQRLVKVKDISDYAALSNATDDLIELARSSGATLGFLHHGGKSEKSDPIDSPLGSTAIGGAVDALLYLKRGATNRTLQTVQRDGNDLPETIIVMNPDTHHVSLGGTKAEADESDVSRAVNDYLAGLAEPITEAIILENVEGRKSLKQSALRRLVASGAVKRSGAGKSGAPYLYVHAAETDPECLPPLPPTIGREAENPTFDIDEKPCRMDIFATSGSLGPFDRDGGSASASGGTRLTNAIPGERTREPIDL